MTVQTGFAYFSISISDCKLYDENKQSGHLERLCWVINTVEPLPNRHLYV